MLPQHLVFGTPRKLPALTEVPGRVVVLDIAFAGQESGGGFGKVTLPFIDGLGERLRGWIDHHDHEAHPSYANDPRFVLATKAEHGACPEMITPELVTRLGPVDTVVCHTDFDGLVSAAKWMRGGTEPYPGADSDARAIDTCLGKPSGVGERLDRALRARPRDTGLMGIVVRHLHAGLADAALWLPIDAAGREWARIEADTRRLAQGYQRLSAEVAYLEVAAAGATESGRSLRFDKTLLLLLGQELATVSIVAERDSVAVAAGFSSGYNFLKLLRLSGGMPTRVSIPRRRLAELLRALGADPRQIGLT